MKFFILVLQNLPPKDRLVGHYSHYKEYLLRKTGKSKSSGFEFIRFDLCSKEIQDIVQSNYENNL